MIPPERRSMRYGKEGDIEVLGVSIQLFFDIESKSASALIENGKLWAVVKTSERSL